jgi:hypothetical protein
VRVVNPVTPDLGGPQVNKAAGWLARTGIRFSGGRMETRSFLVEQGSQEHRQRRRAGNHVDHCEANCDQFFFLNPLGRGSAPDGTTRSGEKDRKETDSFVKGLILAQNERWRRGLGMQVERAW